MNSFTLKFKNEELENQYIDARQKHIYTLFKYVQTVLLLLTIGLTIHYTIDNNWSMHRYSIIFFACNYLGEIFIVKKYKSLARFSLLLSNVQIAAVHFLFYFYSTKAYYWVDGFSFGFCVAIVNIQLLISYNFLENFFTMVIILFIHCKAVSLSKFGYHVIVIILLSFSLVGQQYIQEKMKRQNFLYVQKEKKIGKNDLYQIFIDKILHQSLQEPFLVCNYQKEKLKFKIEKSNIAAENLFELSKQTLQKVFCKIQVQTYVSNIFCKQKKLSFIGLSEYLIQILEQKVEEQNSQLYIRNQEYQIKGVFNNNDGKIYFNIWVYLYEYDYPTYYIIFQQDFNQQIDYYKQQLINQDKNLNQLLIAIHKNYENQKKILKIDDDEEGKINQLKTCVMLGTNKLINFQLAQNDQIDIKVEEINLREFINSLCKIQFYKNLKQKIKIEIKSGFKKNSPCLIQQDRILVSHLLFNILKIICYYIEENIIITIAVRNQNQEIKYINQEMPIKYIQFSFNWMPLISTDQIFYIQQTEEFKIAQKIIDQIGTNEHKIQIKEDSDESQINFEIVSNLIRITNNLAFHSSKSN